MRADRIITFLLSVNNVLPIDDVELVYGKVFGIDSTTISTTIGIQLEIFLFLLLVSSSKKSITTSSFNPIKVCRSVVAVGVFIRERLLLLCTVNVEIFHIRV